MKVEIHSIFALDLCTPCTLWFSFCVGFLLIYFFAFKSENEAVKNGTAEYPPVIPFNRYAELKEIFSENPSNLLLKLIPYGEEIWRYNTFSPMAPMMCEVFDVNIQRQILTDGTATKPHEIYGLYNILHKGNYNIFSSNGLKWHRARKAVAPAFSAQHLRRMNAVATSKIEKWIQNKLYHYIDRKEPIDIASEMLKLTLSVVVEASFEHTISEKDAESFLEELNIVLLEAAYSFTPFRKHVTWCLPHHRRACIASNRLMDFCKKILKSYESLEFPVKGTVIDCILNNPHYENEDERIADMLIFLIAGHDTSAYTISWTLLELAKHPNEQYLLRSRLKDAALSHRSLCNVDELHYIIKESMRLHPVAAMGTCRKISSNLIIKRDGGRKDYILPKGSITNCSIMNLSRNGKYFKDPDSFIPSRWISPSQLEKDAFMPFLIGKRNCVGQSLANSTLKTIISQLCLEFDCAVSEEGTASCFFSLAPKDMKLLFSKL